MQHLAAAASPEYLLGFRDLTSRYEVVTSLVRGFDGRVLHVHELGLGGREDIAIVNPIGTSFLALLPLAAALAETHHVVTWDNRGSPYLSERFDDAVPSTECYAKDLEEIVRAKGLNDVHLVGYCSSASIVSLAARRRRITPRSISLIAPSGIGTCDERLPYELCFIPLLLSVADLEEAKGRAVVDTIKDIVKVPPSTTMEDEWLLRITSLTNRDYEAVRTFARLAKAHQGDARAAMTLFDDACRRIPTLVLHACDDSVTHYKCSLDAVKRNAGAAIKVIVYSAGGHFLAFRSPARVAGYIESLVSSFGRRER